MRFKLTFILLFANVFLFGLIVFNHYHHKQNSSVNFSHLFGKDLGFLYQLDKIVLKSPEWKSARILKRHGQDWAIAEPIEWRANTFVVERLLSQLVFLEHEVVFSVDDLLAAGQSLTDYGLDNPILTVDLISKELTIELQIGKTNDTQGQLYCLRADTQDIFVLNKGFLDHFFLDIHLLRNPQVFTIPSFEVNHFDVKSASGRFSTIHLEKINHVWSFRAPIALRADNNAVKAFLERLYHLSVTSFVDELDINNSVTGLSEPMLKVTIEGVQRRETLLVGNCVNDSSQYYAALEGMKTVFCIDESMVIFVENLLQHLRTKKIFVDDLEDIKKIIFENNGTHFQLVALENGGWKVQQENLVLFDGDPLTIQALIQTVNDLTISKVMSDVPLQDNLEAWGLSKPEKTLSLELPDKTLELLCGFHDIKEGQVYVKQVNEPSVYGVNNLLLDTIAFDPLSYKNKLLPLIPYSAKIMTLKLSNLKTNKVYFDFTDNVGIIDALKSEDVDLTALGFDLKSWLNLLQYFRVKDFINRSFDIKLNEKLDEDWTYLLDIDYLIGEQATPIRKSIYFSDRISGQLQMGGDPQSGVIFYIAQPCMDLIEDAVRPIPAS